MNYLPDETIAYHNIIIGTLGIHDLPALLPPANYFDYFRSQVIFIPYTFISSQFSSTFNYFKTMEKKKS